MTVPKETVSITVPKEKMSFKGGKGTGKMQDGFSPLVHTVCSSNIFCH